jgi:glycosyltransferase involved in cell wall biosynthesis
MRFSVDAHAIGCHLTGNETYIRNLLTEFAGLDQESEFLAYLSVPGSERGVPSRFQTAWVSPNPFRRLGWDLPRALRRDRPDLLHVQYTGPLAAKVPLVVSLHDVSYLDHPEFFTAFRSRQLRITVRRTLRRAAAVLTPSEFSRRSILRSYAIAPERVFAIPNGVSSAFRPVNREHAAAYVAQRFGLRVPYLLTVGDLQPRKNHLGLIAAFEQLLRAHPHLPHRLVLVGKDTWHAPDIRAAIDRSPARERIHRTGFVEDDELLQLYNACEVFVFPSFYEGFGLPILEAMACGRAVACSNRSAMPEVANAAAILFDPGSRAEMVRALSDLVLDAELRARMERLGAARAALFTWHRAAARTLDVYYRVAGATRTEPRLEKARV